MDVEAELVTLLEAETGVKTATRDPDPVPDQFIRVRRKGGPTALDDGDATSIFRDKPLIDIEVTGSNESDAVNISNQVQAFMLTIPRMSPHPFSVTCYGVTQTLKTWFDRTEDGVYIAPRVWLSYDLNMRYNG